MAAVNLSAAPCVSHARGQHCERTDCFSCGQSASVVLRSAAVAGPWPAGILALAREVVRVWDSRSDDAVTVADLAWCYRTRCLAGVTDRALARRLSIAFAEGMTDKLQGAPELQPGDYGDDERERESYRAGRDLVSANQPVD